MKTIITLMLCLSATLAQAGDLVLCVRESTPIAQKEAVADSINAGWIWKEPKGSVNSISNWPAFSRKGDATPWRVCFYSDAWVRRFMGDATPTKELSDKRLTTAGLATNTCLVLDCKKSMMETLTAAGFTAIVPKEAK